MTDSANQLIRENNQAAGKTWIWTYDDGGNITSRTEYPYSTGGLGTAVSTVNYTYDTEWGDLLTGYNGQTITSDTIGNMLSDGTWTYTWEHGRELASMSGNGETWSFAYNADGMRTSRSNGTTAYSYVYNGSSLSQMTVGTDTLYFAYDASTPMSVTYNGSTYYYVTNLQGDVTAILNSAGAPVVTYTYDAWGNILSTSGTMADSLGTLNPLRYRSYVYDHETSLYYLQSRYYDPELGRFINADAFTSTGQGFVGNNMFAYCNNDPVGYLDSTGNLPIRNTMLMMSDGGPAAQHIYGQSHEPYASMSNGVTDVDWSGCGAVAIYNAAQSIHSVSESLGEIIDYLESHDYLLAEGVFGTNPYGVIDYFLDQGKHVGVSLDVANVEHLAEEADACIMYYAYLEPRLGHHLVAFEQHNGIGIYYNHESTSKGPFIFRGTPYEYLKENGFAGFVILIFEE